MNAKYAIVELDNGWVLSSESGEVFYNTISELLRVIASEEGAKLLNG